MLRILLADDEPLVLIGLQGMLEWEKLGYTVCGTARNGKIALEVIEREQPDIVIADVKTSTPMPPRESGNKGRDVTL